MNDVISPLFSLAGRSGIVTGASAGIGRAVAHLLGHAGATVYNFSRRATQRNVDLPWSDKVIDVAVDITNEQSLSAAIAEVGAQRGIDFLVNNAGKTRRVAADDVDGEFWREIHALNVDALFRASQLCLPWLQQSPYVGRIINVSSMAAQLGFSGVTPYCSTKAAVMGITRGLAVEWAGKNVLVNAVAPGWVQTNMTATVADPQRLEKILARMPLHRYGDAWSELAPVFCFLLSDGARYINGQEIAVDGGALSFGF